MDEKSLREAEYDAQLFGFTVEDFMTYFRQLIQDEVARLTSSMATSLIKKYPPDDPEIQLINKITTTLVNKYVYAAEEPLNSLKVQLKELFHIPPHVLLPGDEAQRIQYTVEEEKEVDNELEDLYQRIKRAKAFKLELLQEINMLQEALPDLTRQVEELENIVAKQDETETHFEQLQPVIERTVHYTKTMLEHQGRNDF